MAISCCEKISPFARDRRAAFLVVAVDVDVLPHAVDVIGIAARERIHVAAALPDLSKAGLTGIGISLVNYINELPYFCDEILGRLQRIGLRAKRSARMRTPQICVVRPFKPVFALAIKAGLIRPYQGAKARLCRLDIHCLKIG